MRIWNFTQFRFGGQMLHHWTTESCAKCLGHMWNAPRKLIRSAIFWSKQYSVRTAEVLFVAKDSNVFFLPHAASQSFCGKSLRSIYSFILFYIKEDMLLRTLCNTCIPGVNRRKLKWTEERVCLYKHNKIGSCVWVRAVSVALCVGLIVPRFALV